MSLRRAIRDWVNSDEDVIQVAPDNTAFKASSVSRILKSLQERIGSLTKEVTELKNKHKPDNSTIDGLRKRIEKLETDLSSANKKLRRYKITKRGWVYIDRDDD